MQLLKRQTNVYPLTTTQDKLPAKHKTSTCQHSEMQKNAYLFALWKTIKGNLKNTISISNFLAKTDRRQTDRRSC